MAQDGRDQNIKTKKEALSEKQNGFTWQEFYVYRGFHRAGFSDSKLASFMKC